ncbi:MAG TPA: PQQ-binding-like beta-propeller repeat protein [Candidatus Lokiarchaeia archaeon]|nr:PQQ-binding-like beta-propeller repeat protein [Candidatus Lokiarchaeia archaeon]
MKNRPSRITWNMIAFMLVLGMFIAIFTPLTASSSKRATFLQANLALPRLATIPGSSDPNGDEWPMCYGALNHSGVATTTSIQKPAQIWTYHTEGRVHSSPAITSGRVYVGSSDYNVYCLNATTGVFIWSYTTGNWVMSSPAVADGRVYIGGVDCKVYCLDAISGALVWNYTTVWQVYSSPAVAYGDVFVGSGNYMYCLNANTGALVWKFPSSSAVYSSPSIAGGRVYFANEDYRVYCLNATSGAYIWAYLTGSNVYPSIVVASGLVYFSNAGDAVYCLNATTGVIAWLYSSGPGVHTEPAVYEGRVYVGCDGKGILCLNATTGAEIWLSTANISVTTPPAIAGGRVYVGSDDDKIYCLNVTTGSFLWDYATSAAINSPTAITAGCLYLGNEAGIIYCIPMIFTLPNGTSNTINLEIIISIVIVIIIVITIIAGLIIARKKKVHALINETSAAPTEVATINPEKITCNSCGAVLNNYPGVRFCPYCGAYVQTAPPLLSPAQQTPIQPVQEVPWLPSEHPQFLDGVGVGLCVLGGILSILFGLGLPVIYPAVFQFGFTAVAFILMAMVITGGIITLVGVAIVNSRPKIGQKIIIIGALVSGINLITIFGIARLNKTK